MDTKEIVTKLAHVLGMLEMSIFEMKKALERVGEDSYQLNRLVNEIEKSEETDEQRRNT